MMDKRVRWQDSRWIQTLFIPLTFLFGTMLAMVLSTPKSWLLGSIFMNGVGALIYVSAALGMSRYRPYICMKSPYLIPYDEKGEVISRLDYEQKNVVWKDNPVWKDTITVGDIHGDNVLLSDSHGKEYQTNFINAIEMLSRKKDGVVEGYFTYERRNYNRYTAYYVRYGK